MSLARRNITQYPPLNKGKLALTPLQISQKLWRTPLPPPLPQPRNILNIPESFTCYVLWRIGHQCLGQRVTVFDKVAHFWRVWLCIVFWVVWIFWVTRLQLRVTSCVIACLGMRCCHDSMTASKRGQEKVSFQLPPPPPHFPTNLPVTPLSLRLWVYIVPPPSRFTAPLLIITAQSLIDLSIKWLCGERLIASFHKVQWSSSPPLVWPTLGP